MLCMALAVEKRPVLSQHCRRQLMHGSNLSSEHKLSAQRPHVGAQKQLTVLYPASTKSLAFSATAIVGALVNVCGIPGNTEASMTRRPATPLTRKASSTTAPMRQVPTGWWNESAARRTNLSMSVAFVPSGPG